MSVKTDAKIKVSVEGVEASAADLARPSRAMEQETRRALTDMRRGFGQTLSSAAADARRAQREVQAGLSDAAASFGKAAGGIRGFSVEVTTSMRGVRNTLTEIHSGFRLIEGGARAVAGAMQSLIGTPLTLAVEFERGISAIRTLGPVPPQFEAQLRDLARRVPQSAADIAKAAYDAISSGIAQADVPRFLEAAAGAAVGGQVDLTTATNTLTSSLNAFRAQGLDASRAADILFQTMNKGVITFADFEKFQGKTLATASNLGISFEELNAAVATLTLKGVRPEAAYDRLNAAFVALSATTKQAKDGAARYGVETGVSALQAKGLTGVLESLSKATGGSAAALVNLTDRQEAQQALTILLGEGMKTYKDNLQAIQGAAGAAGRATDIMSADTQGLIDLFKKDLSSILQEVGRQLLPSLRQALLSMREALSGERGQAIVTTLKTIGEGVIFIVKALADASRRALDFVAKMPAFRQFAEVQRILNQTSGAAGQAAKDLGVLGGAFDNIVERTNQLKVSLTTTVRLIALQGQVTQAASVFSKAAEGGVFNAVETAKAAQTLADAGRQLQQAFSLAQQEDQGNRQAVQRARAAEQAAEEAALDAARKRKDEAAKAGADAARQAAADRKTIAENEARVQLELIADASERQILELTEQYESKIALARRYGADTTFLERRLEQELTRIRVDGLAERSRSQLEALAEENARRRAVGTTPVQNEAAEVLRLETEALRNPIERQIALRRLAADDAVAQVQRTYQSVDLASRAEVAIRAQAERDIAAIREDGARATFETLQGGLDRALSSTSGLFSALGTLLGASQAFRKAQLIAEGVFYAVKAGGYAAEAGAALGTGNIPGFLSLTSSAIQAAATSKAAFAGAARLKGPGGGGSTGVPTGRGGGAGLPQARSRADFGPARQGAAGQSVTLNVILPVGDGGFMTRADAREGGRRIATYTRRHLEGAAR